MVAAVGGPAPPAASSRAVCRGFLLFFLAVSSAAASVLDLGRAARSRAEGGAAAGDLSVVRCSFLTGAGSRGPQGGAPLSSFFVPASDRAMYEEGLKDYLQQIGAQPSELDVVCSPYVGSEAVSCQLCLYNEVSRDLKHVRQGQVLSSLLPQCMQGSFDQALKMPSSQYHPICYPEEKANEAEVLRQAVSPHSAADGSCSN